MKITDYRKKKISPTGLKVILKLAVMLILTFLISEITGSNITMAGGNINTVPSYRYDGYDYILSYKVNGPLTGQGTYTMYHDLKNMDFINCELCLYAGKCKKCGYPESWADNSFRVNINGYYGFSYADNTPNGKDYPANWYINPLKLEAARFIMAGDPPAEIKAIYDIHEAYCLSCHEYRQPQLYMNEIAFIDKRGVAVMKQASYNVPAGTSLTVDPSYNEYADHVRWGVKFPGETCYTMLSDGENKAGLIANGVTNRTISISNIPYVSVGFDLGVFVYDKDDQLPGNTTISDTPFYAHITCPDNSMPSVSVNKTPNADRKSVTVTLTGTDKEGLHAKPFSWDGGKTFTEESTKTISKIGIYQVAVRDAAGNITIESFLVDSSDIKGSSQGGTAAGSGSSTVIADKTPTRGSGTNASGSGTGGSSGNGLNSGTSSGAGLSGSTGAGSQAGTGSLSSIVAGQNGELVAGGNASTGRTSSGTGGNGDSKNATNSGNVAESKTGKGSGKSAEEGGTSDSSLNLSEISDADSSEMFERIRKNSNDYIIAMHDEYRDEERMASAEETKELTVEEIEKGADEKKSMDTNESELNYTALGNSENSNYKPSVIRDSRAFRLLIIALAVLLLLILSYVLFFGVLILKDRDDEIIAVCKSGPMKVPAGLAHITYSDGRFSICFKELLDRNDVLYARPGVLFVYMFDGEKIGIETKFRGDRKREIAVETIRREIKVGSRSKSVRK